MFDWYDPMIEEVTWILTSGGYVSDMTERNFTWLMQGFDTKYLPADCQIRITPEEELVLSTPRRGLNNSELGCLNITVASSMAYVIVGEPYTSRPSGVAYAPVVMGYDLNKYEGEFPWARWNTTLRTFPELD